MSNVLLISLFLLIGQGSSDNVRLNLVATNAPNKTNIKLKNPWVYGVYSAVVPGLGQILNGRYERGTLIMGIVSALVYATVDAIGDYNFAYKEYLLDYAEGDQLSAYRHYEIANKRFYIANALIVVTSTFYFLNIIDAVWEAKTQNIELLKSSSKSKVSLYPRFEITKKELCIGTEVSFRLN